MSTDVLKVSGNYLLDARNGDMTINVTNASTDHTGTVTIIGNLDVIGQSTQIEVQDSRIKDNILVLNSGETNAYVSLGTSGLLIARGNSDELPNAATLLYNDANYWNVSSVSTRGVFEFNSALAGSAIQINAIRINQSNGNLTLNILGDDNPLGMINVKGTDNYASRVLDDDDIPNKKYVDSAVYSGTDIAKRLQVGDSAFRIVDNSLAPTDPFFAPSSKIWGTLNTSTNVVFRLEGTEAQIQGITINDHVISVNTTATDLVLQVQTGTNIVSGTASVAIDSPLKLKEYPYGITPEEFNTTIYNSGTPGGGGTGLYYVNTTDSDELVSRRKAIIYGIIF
jgi:hypothetical protein